MSVADVDALSWWEWRLLIEGLDAEARANAGEPQVDTPAGPAEAHDRDVQRFTHAGITFRTVKGG